MATGEATGGDRVRIVIAPKGGKAEDWKKLEESLGGNTRVIDVPLKTLIEPKPVEEPKPKEKPL